MPVHRVFEPAPAALVEAWERYTLSADVPSHQAAFEDELLVFEGGLDDGSTQDYLETMQREADALATEVDALPDEEHRQVVNAALFHQDLAKAVLAQHRAAQLGADDQRDAREVRELVRRAEEDSKQALAGFSVVTTPRLDVKELADATPIAVDRVLDVGADAGGEAIKVAGAAKLSDLLAHAIDAVSGSGAFKRLVAGARKRIEMAVRWLARLVGADETLIAKAIKWIEEKIGELDVVVDKLVRYGLSKLVDEKAMVEGLQAAIRSSDAGPDRVQQVSDQLEAVAARVEKLGGLIVKGVQLLKWLALISAQAVVAIAALGAGVVLLLVADALDWHDELLEEIGLGRPGIESAVASLALASR